MNKCSEQHFKIGVHFRDMTEDGINYGFSA